MLLSHPTVVPEKRGERILWRVYCGTDMDGKPVRHYRNTKADADSLARDVGKRVRKVGTAAAELTAAQTYDAAEAIRLLHEARTDIGLAECARQWIAQSRDVLDASAMPLGDALKSYLARLPQNSEHHKSVERLLGGFADMFGDSRPMMEIVRADIEKFLAPYSTPKSYNLKRGYLLAFLNWGRKQGHYPAGLYERATCLDRKLVPYRPPVFFRAKTVAAIMEWAERQDDAALIVPRFALGFFAGIRTAEIDRMTWRDIHFDTMDIRVETPKGITGTPPRIVTMSENLAAWLAPYAGKDADSVGYRDNTLTEAKKRLDAELKMRFTSQENRNVMRHTFATMHAAYHKNFELTAAEMGHGISTVMLRKHYQSITSLADADAFWNIKPMARGMSFAVGA